MPKRDLLRAARYGHGSNGKGYQVRRLLPLLATLVAVQAASTSLAERRVSEEALLFRQVRSGVATVFGDQGSGSGFLVDSLGILLTNDHVVGGSARIRVKFDDSTRVDAQLLATDPKRDVAAIRVAPDISSRYAILPLAQPSDSMVFEGEKVIAIGSPLHQEKVMTSGIVSKVEPTAIISDVNLNHGNSGGPLINMDGQVIAINTFGDITDQGGPGISGSISISQAFDVLARARVSALGTTPPSDSLLAVAPRTPFPLDSLQEVAMLDKFDHAPYEVTTLTGTGKFNVSVVTPIYDAWRANEYSAQLAKRMRRREQKGNVAPSEAYSPTRQMRDWMQYTGNAGAPGNSYAALVTIEMSPKIGETSGSVWGNILGSAIAGGAGSYYRGKRKYEFKGDFKDVVVTRDGVPIPDVLRAKVTVPLAFATSTWNADYVGEDMARVGLFQCTSDWFAPDSSGPPKIHVAITSVEKPDKPYEFDLPVATVWRVWNDFAAYRHQFTQGVASSEVPRSAPSDSTQSADAAPYIIRLETGEVIGAIGVGLSDYEMLKVILADKSVKYVSAAKVYSITGPGGHDYTQDVLDHRKRIGEQR